MTEARTQYGACNLCEAICGLEFKVRDNRIESIRPDPQDPLSRGHICPKAVALKDVHEDPDRLRRPVRREPDGSWREIDWDQALDLAADRLAAIHEAHGADAIAAYLGNPNVHNYGSMTHAQHFLGHIKTRNRYSATSCDQLPHQLVAWWLYGHQLLVPIPDIDRTGYLLMLGANPMASNGSLMTVPDFRGRLKALQSRGGKLVVIDPRRSETAAVADRHHFIRPGTDAAFLLLLLQCLLQRGAEPGRLAAFVDGVDTVCAAIRAPAPAELSAACGIPVDAVDAIAAEFLAAGAAVCYGRMGVSTQRHGTLCQWLIQLVNVLTGNLDREGGALFTLPAVDSIGAGARPGHFDKWRSRVRQLPEFGGELPAATMVDEMLTDGEGQVRAFIAIAGNPVLSTPDGEALAAALEAMEFVLAVDFYINETTRHADLILPPTCAVEHDHYDLIFHVFAVRNTARFSEAVVEPADDARHDWEIFTALGERLAQRLGSRPRGGVRPEQIIDMGLQSGPYGAAGDHPAALSLEALKRHPHGIDLGPLSPSLPQRLVGRQRIDLAVPAMLDELAAFAGSLAEPAADAEFPLRLIGRRHVRSNNSWMHNYHRLVKGKRRDQLLMHGEDLAALGLADGATVRLVSRRGAVEVPVSASDEIMPGVVSLPHGWGHGRRGTRLTTANAHPGVNANALTDPEFLDMSGNAALNGVPVRVEAV